MKVIPKLPYRHANMLSNTAVVVDVQDCVIATNQPDWEADAKIFIECQNGAPEMLLMKDDYHVVVEDTGYFNCHGDKRLALLRSGDKLVPRRFKGNTAICEGYCHNSERQVLVEIGIDERY